jgi:tetratricopeptide (TPR) repeat protein
MISLILVRVATVVTLLNPMDVVPGHYADSVIPHLTRRFGIHSLPQLREALSHSPSEGGRSYAWLASWLRDPYAGLEAYSALFAEDSTDRQAAANMLELYLYTQEFEKALALAERLERVATVVKDPRDYEYTLAELEHIRCRIFRGMGKLEAARLACEKSIKLGSQGGAQRTLAKILLLNGQPDLALQRATESIQLDDTSASAWFAKGASLFALNRKDEAKDSFRQALKKKPTFVTAQEALDGLHPTVEHLLAAMTQWQMSSYAESARFCGHVYLDLQMPERAKRCLDLADKISPGSSVAETLNHLAEKDPESALKKATEAVRYQQHWLLYWLMASIHHSQKRDEEAKRDLQNGLALDSRAQRLHVMMVVVCHEFDDKDCIRIHTHFYDGDANDYR